MKLANAYTDKARLDLQQIEKTIIALIIESNDELVDAIIDPIDNSKSVHSLHIIFSLLHAANRKKDIYNTLKNGNQDEQKNILLSERFNWLNRVRMLVIVTKKESEVFLQTKIILGLLHSHIVLETILNNIKNSKDEEGAVRLNVLNRCYKTILNELADFEKIPGCHPLYNQLASNLRCMQNDLEQLGNPVSGCRCRTNNRKQVNKIALYPVGAFEKLDTIITIPAIKNDNGIEFTNDLSRSFAAVEEEFERSRSPSSLKRS